MFLDDWIISIENKIYVDSARDERRLVKQYEGLKRKYNDRNWGLVFLVPYLSNNADVLDIRIQLECDVLPEELERGSF